MKRAIIKYIIVLELIINYFWSMKLAAIDIGSNAIRLQIVQVYEENELVSFKEIEFLRFPLRLGHDVFETGEISVETGARFSKLMQTFKLLMDLYEIHDYNAVATSAMRESSNGVSLRDKIEKEIGLNINIISGETEAHILNKAIIPNLDQGSYIHIDVGGGSTELNFFHNKEHQKGQSFQIGSVRKLSKPGRKEVFADMKKWAKGANTIKSKSITAIGTGGNITQLFKIINKKNTNVISLTELKAVRAYIKEFSIEERMKILKMNPDRADVIIPASQIYINVMKDLGSDQIMVPKVGLKDGLIYELFERVSKRSISQIEFLDEG